MNQQAEHSKEIHKRRGGIDPAALAAASLASAISTIAQPGPYTPITMVVGLTILAVVLAYDVEAFRTKFQSFAYSAAAGLTATLALGYPFEVYSQNYIDYNPTSSTVPQWVTVLAWLCFTAAFYVFDHPARRRWFEIAA